MIFSRSAAIALTILLGYASSVYADPSITGVAGEIAQGESVVIQGSSFGVKSTPEPIIWENFESGYKGNDLQGWTLWAGGGTVLPKYSADVKRSGSSILNGMMDVPGSQYTSSAYKPLGNKRQIYASMYGYIDHYGGGLSTNIKMMRLTSGEGTMHGGEPNLGGTFEHTNGLWYGYNYTGNSTNTKWNIHWTEGRWHKYEYYIECSEPPGASNGTIIMWMDGNEVWRLTDTVTMGTGATQEGGEYNYLDRVLLPFYAGNPDSSEYRIFYDDLYVDDTQAHVELGNASTWSSCTETEVQVPSAWTDNSITVTVNHGVLPFGTAYLYVIDGEGVRNQAGYPVTIEPSSSVLANAVNRWQSGEITREDLNVTVYWYIKGVLPAGDPMDELTEDDIGSALKIAD